MHGVYSWVQGAASASILSDMVRLITGGDVAGTSAACNKAASSVTGVTSWAAVDAAFGVVRQAGVVTGPGVTARLSVSGGGRLQLSAVDGWDTGPHTATHQTTAQDVSLALSAAGSVSFIAIDGVLHVGSSDWSLWAIVAEVKRDGPAMAGAPTKSGAIVLSSAGAHYMARVKTPGSAGEVANANVSVQSAFGSLSGSSARDQSERLYLPMAPATVSYSQVPVEELQGVILVAGYAQSGDTVLDDAAAVYSIAKTGASLFAVRKE